MRFVPSTYQILAWKFFDRSVDQRWADWAVEMMLAGFETESLPMLALLEKPYNQFELKELTDRILDELGLSNQDKGLVMCNYASYLINLGIKEERDISSVLNSLKDMYLALDGDATFLNFYLLAYAKEDLNFSEVQYYWDGADRTNIDKIISEEFQKWIRTYPIS